jgi:hypothetical protein
MSPKERFNIMLEPDQLEELRKLQERTGASVSELVRRAIAAFLETSRKKRT